VIDQWYYWRGGDVVGPISGLALSELGTSGGIEPGDTVWREGFEHGVPASRVKNLFPSVDAPVEPAAPVVEVAVPPAGRAMPPPRRARAVAGRGTIIMGQDGKTVRYKMKCTTCGHEDSSSRSATITRGTTRTKFHCPKCRKLRVTEFNGVDC